MRGVSSKDHPALVAEEPMRNTSVSALQMLAQGRGRNTIVNHNCCFPSTARLDFLVAIAARLDKAFKMCLSCWEYLSGWIGDFHFHRFGRRLRRRGGHSRSRNCILEKRLFHGGDLYDLYFQFKISKDENGE